MKAMRQVGAGRAHNRDNTSCQKSMKTMENCMNWASDCFRSHSILQICPPATVSYTQLMVAGKKSPRLKPVLKQTNISSPKSWNIALIYISSTMTLLLYNEKSFLESIGVSESDSAFRNYRYLRLIQC